MSHRLNSSRNRLIVSRDSLDSEDSEVDMEVTEDTVATEDTCTVRRWNRSGKSDSWDCSAGVCWDSERPLGDTDTTEEVVTEGTDTTITTITIMSITSTDTEDTTIITTMRHRAMATMSTVTEGTVMEDTVTDTRIITTMMSTTNTDMDTMGVKSGMVS
ncbi:hypothetical protein pipiens_018035 [Culex pipiens pipiens]|uniref:Uncharacterized protein n=1 Tax=Culex pipiens pipiens TaxID=38569 RepID=A0ABD1CDS0_CULPP